MKTVAQLLNAKQNQQVYTIGADEMVLDALRLMAEKNIGALLVVNHGEVVGVVSERDYARKMVLKGRSSIGTPISAIMSAPMFFSAIRRRASSTISSAPMVYTCWFCLAFNSCATVFIRAPPEPFSRPARIVDGERIGKRGKRHRTD